jgi:hypothetical protein
MPSPAEILETLSRTANAWLPLAFAWHLAAAALLLGLLRGRITRPRTVGLLLALPLLSVSALSFAAGNGFNGVAFAALALLGIAATARRGTPAPPAPRAICAAGLTMIGYGWIYPHFLEGSAITYLYAAPLGLVPCPTLAAVIGFGLLGNGLASRAWSLTFAAAGLFYGIFGAVRLGVMLDLGLVASAAALLALGVRRPFAP